MKLTPALKRTSGTPSSAAPGQRATSSSAPTGTGTLLPEVPPLPGSSLLPLPGDQAPGPASPGLLQQAVAGGWNLLRKPCGGMTTREDMAQLPVVPESVCALGGAPLGWGLYAGLPQGPVPVQVHGPVLQGEQHMNPGTMPAWISTNLSGEPMVGRKDEEPTGNFAASGRGWRPCGTIPHPVYEGSGTTFCCWP